MNGYDDNHIKYMLRPSRGISQENPGILGRFASFDDHITPTLGLQPYEHHNGHHGHHNGYHTYGAPVLNRSNNRIRSGKQRFLDSA